MKHDYHIHTYFSGDSETHPEDTIKQAISLGLKTICFTDHHDIDYPEEPNPFTLDAERYFKELLPLKNKYSEQIDIRIGVELGIQPDISHKLNEFSNAYPFDFIIGSTHVVEHTDPYYTEVWGDEVNHSRIIEAYLTETIESINNFNNFDVMGHLDYIIRYCPSKDKHPEILDLYTLYPELLDKILITLIENGKGIELNTGGLKNNLPNPNPHPRLLSRYRELGGEIITCGSDGHKPEHIAYSFNTVPELLQSCGFKYMTIFKNRKPEWIKL
ncbi:MAG: histidinol-phosphatase HisJ family protein [Lachnospiraceae bacterium]|nr:histidinol-phosphatase HisJ family protein [Lachnospiraceae bacterium]